LRFSAVANRLDFPCEYVKLDFLPLIKNIHLRHALGRATLESFRLA
jgi:hypothetical protein